MFWNKVRLVASLRKRQCIKILKKWQALNSAQNGQKKKQPNDNSKPQNTAEWLKLYKISAVGYVQRDRFRP